MRAAGNTSAKESMTNDERSETGGRSRSEQREGGKGILEGDRHGRVGEEFFPGSRDLGSNDFPIEVPMIGEVSARDAIADIARGWHPFEPWVASEVGHERPCSVANRAEGGDLAGTSDHGSQCRSIVNKMTVQRVGCPFGEREKGDERDDRFDLVDLLLVGAP